MPKAHHKSVTIGSFHVVMDQVLEEYKKMTSDGMQKAADDTSKEVQKLTKERARGRLGGTGEYAGGWAVRKYADTYAHHRRTVYNRKVPGLAHLLEHGHGGPQPADPHPHIVTDEETEEIFTRNVHKVIEEE